MLYFNNTILIGCLIMINFKLIIGAASQIRPTFGQLHALGRLNVFSNAPQQTSHWTGLNLPESALANRIHRDLKGEKKSAFNLLQESIHVVHSTLSGESLQALKRSSKRDPLVVSDVVANQNLGNKDVFKSYMVFSKQFNAQDKTTEILQTMVSHAWKPLLLQLKNQGFKGNVVKDLREF